MVPKFTPATKTRTWFSDNNVDVLPWPVKSPDLNIIENLWGLLARAVYKDFRQYNSEAELKEAIVHCWSEIDLSSIEKLYESMPGRCRDVLERQGRAIDA